VVFHSVNRDGHVHAGRDKFPEPALLPEDPAQRARCRYLELKFDTEVDALVVALGTMKLFRPDLQSEFPDALARAEKLIADYHGWLDRELDGRDWFLGELSLADIALAPHLASAAFMGYPVAKEHRSLACWLARAGERPSIAQATREMAEGFASAQSDPDSLFDPKRLHWRNDRIEALIRCGLGQWLVDEFAADRAFLSPVP
jgi:hypothetical protein